MSTASLLVCTLEIYLCYSLLLFTTRKVILHISWSSLLWFAIFRVSGSLVTTACPQIADGGGGLQIRRVAEKMLYNQSQTAGRERFSFIQTNSNIICSVRRKFQ
jgi:hypothetical protein